MERSVSQDESPLVMAVLEEQPVGAVVGNLTAVDEDIDENALIDYLITCKSERHRRWPRLSQS